MLSVFSRAHLAIASRSSMDIRKIRFYYQVYWRPKQVETNVLPASWPTRRPEWLDKVLRKLRLERIRPLFIHKRPNYYFVALWHIRHYGFSGNCISPFFLLFDIGRFCVFEAELLVKGQYHRQHIVRDINFKCSFWLFNSLYSSSIYRVSLFIPNSIWFNYLL